MKRIIISLKIFLLAIIFSTQSCKKSDSTPSTPGTTPKKLIVSTVAAFSTPTGVALGPNGKIYVAEYSKSIISVIAANGNISLLAGNGNPGFTNGTGANAQLFYPQQITIDAAENVFVVGGYNGVYDKVRKITPNGTVTAIAGNGTPGYSDGDGVNAQFKNPFGIVSDLQGNLFVSDADNHKIRKINSANVVSTFASGGFNEPSGITIDASGNLYVADTYNNRIKKITPAGIVSIVAGTGTGGYKDGTSDVAQFNWPTGIAVDKDGNLFIGDALNHRIRKITPAGVVSTYAGTGVQGFADGESSVAIFNLPTQIAVDKEGNVYVADTYNNRIRKISLQ
ncbi:NHL repeat-containing protein [Ferruginibacter sp.]